MPLFEDCCLLLLNFQIRIDFRLIGAVMGIALALYRGQLRHIAGNVVKLVGHHSAVGLAAHPEINVRNQNSLRLPYALPIAAGCLVTFFLSSGKGLVL